MKITINDHRKIYAVQEEFNKLFPHLRIEFMSKPSKVGEAASKKMAKEKGSIGDCRVIHTKGDLTLSPAMTIADLQQSLSDNYGLTALIFEKSGSTWVESAGKGKLSLEEQDKKHVLTF
jgi:hypothetical protein